MAVHPGVGPEATAAACYLNNGDNVFLVEDMKGFFRVVGCARWITKTTVTQDNGQGPTGSVSTTINVEATDEVPAPFYSGIIETEDGELYGESYDDSDDGPVPVYDNIVSINGVEQTISGGEISVHGPLRSLNFTGLDMLMIKVQVDRNTLVMANMSDDGTSASWTGYVEAPTSVLVNERTGIHDELWFIISIT